MPQKVKRRAYDEKKIYNLIDRTRLKYIEYGRKQDC